MCFHNFNSSFIYYFSVVEIIKFISDKINNKGNAAALIFSSHLFSSFKLVSYICVILNKNKNNNNKEEKIININFILLF